MRFDTVMCDSCDKTVETEGAIGWWQIDDAFSPVRTYGETEPPYHLCSWECVETFAARKRLGG